MTKSAAQLLRETMDALNSVGVDQPVVEAIGRSYEFEMTVPNPIPSLDPNDETYEEEIEVGVDYTMHGKYYPQTWDSPAEYPEVDEVTVYDVETGKDITTLMSKPVMEKIDEKCWEHYSNKEPDEPDYDPSDDYR